MSPIIGRKTHPPILQVESIPKREARPPVAETASMRWRGDGGLRARPSFRPRAGLVLWLSSLPQHRPLAHTLPLDWAVAAEEQIVEGEERRGEESQGIGMGREGGRRESRAAAAAAAVEPFLSLIRRSEREAAIP